MKLGVPSAGIKKYFAGQNRKNILIVAVAAVIVLFFYLISIAITGFVTYSEGIKVNATSMQAAIDTATAEKQACEHKLAEAGSKASACQQAATAEKQECDRQKSALSAHAEALGSNLTQCVNDKEGFKGLYQSGTEELKTLAMNSARNICCRPGIAVTNWNILNGTVLCSGRYYLNCATGESDF